MFLTCDWGDKTKQRLAVLFFVPELPVSNLDPKADYPIGTL